MTETPARLPLPTKSEAVLNALRTRRSNLAKVMGGEGPDAETLKDILTIGARVPDHRKLEPWRFIIFEGQARADFGQHIGSVFLKENPDMPLDRVLFESARLQRAPLVIAVLSSPKECIRGTPKWEQELSAATVCYNVLLAAQAHGFGAQWLTEWYAYDATVLKALGANIHEKVAGFIFIGQTDEAPMERARPNVVNLVQFWAET